MENPYQAQAAQAWVGLGWACATCAPDIENLYLRFFTALDTAPKAIAALRRETPSPQVAKSAAAALFKALEETLGDIYETVENLSHSDQRDVEPVAMALSKTLHSAQMDAARAIGVKLP